MTDDFTHMTHDADRTPILWTDGAVSSLPIRTKTGCLWPGGWAVILRHEGATHRTAGYHRQTNSQRMEMMAVVMALYQCRSRKLRGAVIYSNSDYCVKTLTEYAPKWTEKQWAKRKNTDLVKEGLELITKIGAAVLWIPTGHNREAHTAADIASRTVPIRAQS